MNNISYLSFREVEPEDLIGVLNEDSLRVHLIDHPYFNANSIREWIEDKLDTDAKPGCRVRVVTVDGAIAGWCGIQPDDEGFELAIVISQAHWGVGLSIFKTLMSWASELGHEEVLFHLLDSRREYKALTKMATKVKQTELLGRQFTTYYLSTAK